MSEVVDLAATLERAARELRTIDRDRHELARRVSELEEERDLLQAEVFAGRGAA